MRRAGLPARLRALADSESGRAAGQTLVLTAGRAAGSVLALGYTLLLTRTVPVAEVGQVFSAMSLALILSAAASLNLEAGSIRFLPLYHGAARAGDAAGFLALCRRSLALASGLAALAVAALFVAGAIGPGAGPWLVGLAAAPVVALNRIDGRHAAALGAVLAGSLPHLLVRPLLQAATLGLCLALGVVLSATGVMVLFLLSAGVTTLLQSLLLRPHLAFCRGARPRMAEAREWIGLGLMLSPMLLLVQYMRDVIVLSAGWVLTAEDVAQIGIGTSLIGVLYFAVLAVDMVLGPRLARAVQAGDGAGVRRLLARGTVLRMAAFGLGALAMVPLVPAVLSLMGAAYGGVAALFAVLLVVPLAHCLFGPASLVLTVLGFRRVLMPAAVAGVAAMVAGTVLGGHLWGLTGATAGAAAGYAAAQALLWLLCRRHSGIDTSLLSIRGARLRTA